ncbi:MAG: hypothetical protein DCC67_14225 [Planctomycetota bacterium]|nr:MAG: hypothetical protein DCC67_14225 [Planctomycetota bacterium]
MIGYTLAQIAIVSLVMTCGGVVQGAVGFASGLMCIPLLVLCGFSLLEATVVNFILTGIQNATGAVQLWSHLRPREVAGPVLLRCLGLPLGLHFLGASQGLDPTFVKQITGVALLAIVALLRGLRIQPREHIPWPWCVLAFTSSGFLMGLASIGGAPMVIYVNSLNWSAAKSRGFIFFCSAALVPLMAAMLVHRFGGEALRPAALALVALPPVALGLWVGLRLGHRLDKQRFTRLTYGLLVVVALTAILAPVVFNGR